VLTFTLNVVAEIVTGLHSEEPQLFQLYPNPTTSTITLPNASELRRVTIRDMQGRLISSCQHDRASENLTLEQLPAGIYLIEWVDHQNTTTIRKVVKE
jgi:hypothetical protein